MSVADRLDDDKERREWSDDRGSMTFVRVRPHLALIVIVGKLVDESAEAWEQHFPWVIGARGELSLFIDAAAVSFPSTRLIGAATSLFKAARARLPAVHVLVSGGLVEMMAKTANLTLGGLLTITRDRGVFEAELDRALEP